MRALRQERGPHEGSDNSGEYAPGSGLCKNRESRQALIARGYDDFYNLVILKAKNGDKAQWLASYDEIVGFVDRVRRRDGLCDCGHLEISRSLEGRAGSAQSPSSLIWVSITICHTLFVAFLRREVVHP
jgi:hypothetical protein